MKKLQAYKFELMPNGEQIRAMCRFAGSCRFVYNKALAWQNEQYQADNSFKFSYTKLANLLPEWKKSPDTLWLSESPSQTLQQALKNLESSFKNFFAKRADFPKFKKRGQSDSFRYPQGFKVEQGNSRLLLPKLGWVRYRNSRTMQGVAKNITISQSCGKWYASIQTELEVDTPLHSSTTAVGIDVGVTKFATLSTGEIFEPKNSFRNKAQRLARYQRAMSRKKKFSNNWHKAKRKINKLHTTIANIRRDHLHKTSTAISKNHAMIVIEDLQIRNMSKSSKGTSEKHGKNVKAKSGLNKSILDQGWFEFRRQLTIYLHSVKILVGGYHASKDKRAAAAVRSRVSGKEPRENKRAQQGEVRRIAARITAYQRRTQSLSTRVSAEEPRNLGSKKQGVRRSQWRAPQGSTGRIPRAEQTEDQRAGAGLRQSCSAQKTVLHAGVVQTESGASSREESRKIQDRSQLSGQDKPSKSAQCCDSCRLQGWFSRARPGVHHRGLYVLYRRPVSSGHVMGELGRVAFRPHQAVVGIRPNQSQSVSCRLPLHQHAPVVGRRQSPQRPSDRLKPAWRGGYVIAIPPQYTSQRCSCCGYVSRNNRQTQAKFECVECGHSENADINAARNILAAGHAVLACGEMVQSDRSMKQKPTEATTQLTA